MRGYPALDIALPCAVLRFPLCLWCLFDQPNLQCREAGAHHPLSPNPMHSADKVRVAHVRPVLSTGDH
ncbi:uncharacterized protein FFB20_00557 [Fusarium fujikuroi]|uniref:Secreted protein n=1 Tax=Fusarium proliferatum (strain ET1) TaxID=1227346 RepID=A0A1L7V6A1_FUSPR|nr:uncharacterized protein FPRO_03381 [Fusarium proliferatum ET1]SCN64340.1 uncharacterized protein FFB20_00557 [Fusarium fujikuroi]CZR36359.1 uncharacterized protein FPRO_03381 [Fusarium proliferatum ET1]SCN73034.1 uncharacterized protein FFE2_02729 [Fusarium fujikuroi]SCN88862.1 uncharacterized protein FFM5_04544 [Fusarium fujikuroi]SCO04373.1 uncharacterized protein FFC1_09608 [Fusarium fujikuroi]